MPTSPPCSSLRQRRHKEHQLIAEDVTAIGVDGCRVGWVLALAHQNSVGHITRTQLLLIRDDEGGFASLIEEGAALATRPTIAVDVPIGLPEIAGFRDCDREARAALGKRRDCVFRVPDR